MSLHLSASLSHFGSFLRLSVPLGWQRGCQAAVNEQSHGIKVLTKVSLSLIGLIALSLGHMPHLLGEWEWGWSATHSSWAEYGEEMAPQREL